MKVSQSVTLPMDTMDTVQEEPASDYLDVPQIAYNSCPPSRRMTGDSLNGDFKPIVSNSRRTSAIIAALRRPSQTLALTAAHTVINQRKIVMDYMNGEESEKEKEELAGETKQKKQKNSETRFFSDNLTISLSALYAKLLIILGISLPVTEIISLEIPTGFFQGFYLFMYTLSVAFVIFVYLTVMRERAVFSIIKSVRGKDKHHDLHPKKSEKVVRYGSYYLRLGAMAFGIGSMVYSGLEFVQYFEMRKDPHCGSVLHAITPAARMVLTIVQMQFIFLNSKAMRLSRHKVIARFGMMHMVATNMCQWLYVVVEETKHEIIHLEHGPINTAHAIARYIATNISPENASSAANDSMVNTTFDTIIRNKRAYKHDIYECQRSDIMGSLVQNASPFLFPCTIEYSLICAVILFQMWKNVDVKSKAENKGRKNNPVPGNIHASKSPSGSMNQEKLMQAFTHLFSGPRAPKSSHQFSVDCSGAHKGLFSGIILIVVTIISLVMFFVLNKEPSLKHLAIFEVNVWELALYILTLVAIGITMVQMRRFKHFNNNGKKSALGLDTTLLVMAQGGVFIYSMFSIIGCYFTLNEPNTSGAVGFVAELFSLIQTVLQTMFILDAWWRRCRTLEQSHRKPGRQGITFLLVANIAMWTVNTLEKNRAEFRPTHLEFFGVWAWTIITHVSMPLAIFYRFHSSICLFEIWKTAYKMKFGAEK